MRRVQPSAPTFVTKSQFGCYTVMYPNEQCKIKQVLLTVTFPITVVVLRIIRSLGCRLQIAGCRLLPTSYSPHPTVHLSGKSSVRTRLILRGKAGKRVRARLLNFLSQVRASYWFIPSIMLLGTFGLSSLTLSLDRNLNFIDLNLPLLYLTQADGGKTLLGTVAGSMLSVASLTFSIVMVVLTMASSQFGPRLIENFMRDRANQFVLGSFLATFLYCLLVLREVRGGGDVDVGVFVPQLSISVSLILAVFNLGAFIYFIHNTTENIQVANVLGKVSDALTRKIVDTYPEKAVFPESVGLGPGEVEDDADLPPAFERKKATLYASKGGYLRTIDDERLLAVAKEQEVTVRLLITPGSYVMRGGPLMEVYPGSALKACGEQLENQCVLGYSRTQSQDLEFLFDQLLEVALRALSPGINDPLTATRCLDRIGDNLNLLASRDLPSPYRFDESGALRLVIPVLDIEDLVRHLFGPIRAYGAADYLTLNHLLETLRKMSRLTHDPVYRQVLFDEARRVRDEAETKLSEADYARLLEGYDAVREVVPV